MPRRCTVCTHPQRPAIDEAIVSGQAFSGIARDYGLGEDAVGRHAARHIPLALTKAQEARDLARADSLLGQLRALHARTLRLLEEAQASGDLRGAILAVGQARANLEFIARLLERLEPARAEGEKVVIIQFPDGSRKRLQELSNRELDLLIEVSHELSR